MLLARTDHDPANRKQAGITAFALNMRSPSVTCRRPRQITDEHDFNEVFFDRVFVPDSQVIGAVHDGWRVSQNTVTHERGINPRQLVIHLQLLEELYRLAIGNDAILDHRLQQRLADAYVEVRPFHSTPDDRSPECSAGTTRPGRRCKLCWSEMSKRLHDTAMAVLGDAAPLWCDAHPNPGDGCSQRS